jgi:UDP-N-acetylglucosamine 2-epimerase
MKITRIPKAINQRWVHYWSNQRIQKISSQVTKHQPDPAGAPVIFFNASTRLQGMSLNAAYSLLTAWSLRLQGIPVIQFVCNQGLPYCMLGSVLNDPLDLPPCEKCISQSNQLYRNAEVVWLNKNSNLTLSQQIENLSIDQLSSFVFEGVPLGELVLPAIRWVLRCHHLPETERNRTLFKRYIMGAFNTAQQFETLITKKNPQKVVVFNGMSFPEATARWVALKHNVPVITHEVGLMPFTAYFTEGHATAYPIHIPDDFQLNENQNARLDAYLEKRFKGNFSMAGVRFWPTIKSLSEEFLQYTEKYKQIVPVFTNVIFDTSQAHANVVFKHMFDWLDTVLDLIRQNPDTLFVIRAHPDEARPGKASRESVADWAKLRQIEDYDNVVFVAATEYFSSYELILKSKFVMIYNSTIGMEATLLGVPVICGGKSRFTQNPTVYFPKSKVEFIQTTQQFLDSDSVEMPEEFKTNVRRFLYTQLFKVSLPFDDFLEEDRVWQGYVQLKEFNWEALLPENSETLRVLSDGILAGKPMVLDR